MTTINVRELSQDASAALRAADRGPVMITDRAQPAYVLLSITDYNRLKDRRSLVDVLQMDVDVDVEPVVSRTLPKAAEL